MGKIEEAIKKINDEVQKNHSNTNLVRIGEYIIDCITTEEKAEKVLAEKKNLAGCLQNIESKASTYRIGRTAWVDDTVVYGWAREYFDLEETERKPRLELVKPRTPAPKEEPKKSKHLSMDDFF